MIFMRNVLRSSHLLPNLGIRHPSPHDAFLLELSSSLLHVPYSLKSKHNSLNVSIVQLSLWKGQEEIAPLRGFLLGIRKIKVILKRRHTY